MTVWTALFLITVVIAFAVLMTQRQDNLASRKRGKLDDAERRALEEERNDARREIAELRDRIKVLERIATDANTSEALEIQRISSEIDALRDGRKND